MHVAGLAVLAECLQDIGKVTQRARLAHNIAISPVQVHGDGQVFSCSFVLSGLLAGTPELGRRACFHEPVTHLASPLDQADESRDGACSDAEFRFGDGLIELEAELGVRVTRATSSSQSHVDELIPLLEIPDGRVQRTDGQDQDRDRAGLVIGQRHDKFADCLSS